MSKARLVLLFANLAIIASFLGTWSDGH